MEEVKKTKRQPKRDYTYAIGRRREAIARVRLYGTVKEDLQWGDQKVSKDQILVNKIAIEHYFSGPAAKAKYMRPLILADVLNKYAITIQVDGGGKNGQLGAVVNGLARALSAADPKKFRSIMKTNGLLTRDARARERRKVGTGGKARRKKQSPKR